VNTKTRIFTMLSLLGVAIGVYGMICHQETPYREVSTWSPIVHYVAAPAVLALFMGFYFFVEAINAEIESKR
jgi:membrane-bound ClpP family serine protease